MESAPFEAVLRLATTNARIVRELETRIGGHHGLGFSELRLLRALADAPEQRLRPTDLAADLEITASGVTRAILPLEKRGIVKRSSDPQDARSSRVTLTAAGRVLVEQASATASESTAKLMRRLSVGQIKQLERLLTEIG
ncbi:MAG TPA: MarR family transcriptional regulator [Candidatus Baltobacteraceae bacterium]|jgi:DNA-binding MarR family transcriptional regulator|nr:MarR family transcriptional regulator [Candidatus Baltobacteraceae bacterium]